MGLYKFIERVQKKSDGEKKRILTGLTILFGAILLAGWFFSFRATVRDQRPAFLPSQVPIAAESGDSSPVSLRGPLASLKDGLVLFAGDIKEKVEELSVDIGEEKDVSEERPYVPLPIE